ncbi:MAG: ATP-binding protein [Thermoleophilia bacterium]
MSALALVDGESPTGVIAAARSRNRESRSARERVAALGAAGLLVGAVVALAAGFDSPRELSPGAALALVVALAVCAKVEFEIWSGSAVPTHLVLVPMLFVAPAALVPALVAAAYTLAEVPGLVRRRAHPERLLLPPVNALFAIAPSAILAMVGEPDVTAATLPLIAGVLVAGLALDAAVVGAYERLVHGAPLRSIARPFALVGLVDLLLSPIALVMAHVARDEPYAILAVGPLALLLAVFARERRARIDNALSLERASREAAALATERDRVERRLSRVEEDHRALLEALPLTAYAVRRAGAPGLEFVSPQVEQLLGRPARDFQAEPELVTQLVHPDDRAGLAAAREAWRVGGSAFRHEYRIVLQGGETRWLLDQAIADDAQPGRPARGFLLDITERKRLEEQLLQSQRLEAVGRLAGGVAHDFNNLLTAIIGSAEFLLDELPDDDPRRVDALEVRAAADRAARLTGQLLAFSRKQILEPTVLDLNAVVREVDRMLGRLIGEDVELVTHLDPCLPTVHADRGQIEQVVLNLVVNARDAMPSGGRIVLETALHDVPAGSSGPDGVPPGRYVALHVRDTGVGMDEETVARAFEPFFTTKEAGKGTGLGLATVHGVVAQSNGAVAIESRPGVGTTITVLLPQAGGEQAAGEAEAQPPAPRGAGVVLLVEDDPLVGSSVERMLQRLGYAVLAARGADEALALLVARDQPVDLLLTDVIMPGASGRELAGRVTALRPGTPVLYMSGYTDAELGPTDLLDAALLHKPFTRDALGARLAEVLEGAAAPGGRRAVG